MDELTQVQKEIYDLYTLLLSDYNEEYLRRLQALIAKEEQLVGALEPDLVASYRKDINWAKREIFLANNQEDLLKARLLNKYYTGDRQEESLEQKEEEIASIAADFNVSEGEATKIYMATLMALDNNFKNFLIKNIFRLVSLDKQLGGAIGRKLLKGLIRDILFSQPSFGEDFLISNHFNIKDAAFLYPAVTACYVNKEDGEDYQDRSFISFEDQPFYIALDNINALLRQMVGGEKWLFLRFAFKEMLKLAMEEMGYDKALEYYKKTQGIVENEKRDLLAKILQELKANPNLKWTEG